MSWNWDNNEEVKDYEPVGTVTISTKEYRDMVHEIYRLKAAGQKEHDDWYAEYRKCEEFEKKLNLFKSKVTEFNEWLAKDEKALESYKMWKDKKLIKESEEE